jgi:hypothetical protein
VSYYFADKPTSVQLEQARQILNASLFDQTERRRWLLEIQGAPSRFDAGRMLAILAAEYRQRERERATEQDDAA